MNAARCGSLVNHKTIRAFVIKDLIQDRAAVTKYKSCKSGKNHSDITNRLFQIHKITAYVITFLPREIVRLD